MGNVVKTEKGSITVSREVISLIAGIAVIECYGIVGMSPRKVKDGIAEILKRENLNRGVEISMPSEGLVIDLYIVVGYGTKISEVAQNVIEKVFYQVQKLTGLRVEKVNITVQGVKVV